MISENKNAMMAIPTIAMLLLTLMIIPQYIAPAFAAKPQPQSFGITPVVEGESTIAATQPYVAAYHNVSPHFAIKKAKVTCNFAGTDRTKIQPDNFLSCAASLQSPTTVSGLDYGYQAYVTLRQTGSIIVGADVWRACETIPNACDPDGSVSKVSSKTVSISATPSDDVTVFMEWNSAGTSVTFYYQINSGSKTSFHTFTKPSEEHPNFNTGWFTVVPGRTALYFQAGMGSAYNIGQGGWFVWVKNPAYSTTVGGSYNTYYSPGVSVEGDLSFWDRDFKWGGAQYTGVDADYACEGTTSAGRAVFFYNGLTLGTNVRLWGVC
jgi:hypothetical protein